MDKSKVLPQVADMEKSLLGALLLKDGEVIETVSNIITDDDFYREEHRMIYRAILRLYNRQIPPNMLSLVEDLRTGGEIDKIDNKLILSLADIVPTTAYAEHYARKIREKSILRKLVDAGEEITSAAYEDQKPVEEILDEAESKILKITARGETSSFEGMTPIIHRSFERINQIYASSGGFTGLVTGFAELDKVTSGLQKSDLILIAARPSMGKTAFALNLAMQVARRDKVVAIFSLEMSKEQLGQRFLSADSRINSLNLSTGNLTQEELNAIVNSVGILSGYKMFVDDTAGISATELRSKARRLRNEAGLDLIVIDYLQLMQGRSSKGSDFNRQQEISEISRSLKSLARELKVPVIALSQLSRSVELRAEKKPQLSDLRESGSLEQDADIVMFLYRDEYYNPDSEYKNTAEIIIAKNRNGPTKTFRLYFEKECMLFSNLSAEE